MPEYSHSATPGLATPTIDDAFRRNREAAVDTSALVHALTVGTVAFGVTLRLWQYLSAPSLFWGEIALARNIEARGLVQLLTERTAFGQGASPGYLLVQDLVTTLLGSSELTQRFFPFVASVLALVMFVRVAGVYLQGAARLFAVASFALGFPFLFLLAPFKALCSVDTAATLALFLIALETLKPSFNTRRSILAGFAGFALVWFSEAAVIMVAGIALTLLVVTFRTRAESGVRELLPMLLLWSAACAGSWLLEHHVTDDATRLLLRNLYTGAAPPAFPDVTGQLSWLYARLTEALGPAMFHYRAPLLVLIAMVLGIVTLSNVDAAKRALLLTPLVTALIAAAAGWYIFQGFYIAFLFPYLFILLARGAEWISDIAAHLVHLVQRNRDRAQFSASVRTVLLSGWFAIPVLGFTRYLPPFEVADTRSVLSYISERRQPADRMYGITSATHAIAYYGRAVGLNPNNFVVGECHLGAPRETLRELDQFRGEARVWVFFTHDLAKYNVRSEALNYLNRIGTARDSIVLMPSSIPTVVTGASAYLFDLSDAEKLKSASASTVPLLREPPGTKNNGCGSGLYSSEVP